MNKARFGLKSIRLERFRNYASLHLDLAPGLNIFAGPNAQGKTNLLEAIRTLSTARLLRTTRDAEAIALEANDALIEGSLLGSETTLRVTLERGARKRCAINGVGLPRASDLLGRFPTVVVSALDLDIARGEPSARRLFLDLELSQTYPSYLMALTDYKRALEQRNALLKAAQNVGLDALQVEPWEVALAESGAVLRQKRTEFLDQIWERIGDIHDQFAPGESLGLTYEPKDEARTAEELLRRLEESRRIDVLRGTTTVGPHRDDFALMVDGIDLRAFGSQGQQRSAVISLKLATLILGTDLLGAAPAILLDDMLSDLDAGRRSRLVEWVVEHADQAVLTCTEAEAAGSLALDRAQVYDICAGTATPR